MNYSNKNKLIFFLFSCLILIFLLVIFKRNDTIPLLKNQIKIIDTLFLNNSFNAITNITYSDTCLIVRRNTTKLKFGIYDLKYEEIKDLKYFFTISGDSCYIDSLFFRNNFKKRYFKKHDFDCGSVVLFHRISDNGLFMKRVYFSNNFLKSEQRFILNDTVFNSTWYHDKVKRSSEVYKSNKLINLLFWDERGNLIESKIKAGSNFLQEYFSSTGQIIQSVLSDSIDKKLVFKSWCNGEIIDSSLFNQGKFTRKRYYCNGLPQDKLTYIDEPAYLIDSIFTWYDNGKIKLQGFYKIIDTVSPGGIPHGVWKLYSMDGKLLSKKTYKNGTLIKEEKF